MYIHCRNCGKDGGTIQRIIGLKWDIPRLKYHLSMAIGHTGLSRAQFPRMKQDSTSRPIKWDSTGNVYFAKWKQMGSIVVSLVMSLSLKVMSSFFPKFVFISNWQCIWKQVSGAKMFAWFRKTECFVKLLGPTPNSQKQHKMLTEL